MNKTLRNIMLPLLTLSMLAVSCGTPTKPKTSDFVEESVVTLSTKEISSGNLGGYMIEIANDSFLEADNTYACTYSPNLSDTTIDVRSSRPESATIEMTGKNAFKVVTHAAGDSILTIYDADGIVCYNKVLHVRTPYTPENILKAVAHYDIYTSTGIYGSYRFVVTDVYKSFATAVVSGQEVTAEKTGKAVFDMDYEGIAENSPFDGHFYYYSCTIDKESSDLPDLIKEVYISKTADRIYVYYAESSTSTEYYLLEMFQPQSLKGGE